MRRDFWACVAVIGLVGLSVGCNPPPENVKRVPSSALPASARAQLAPEAEIIRVEQHRYGESLVYRVLYRYEGEERTVDLNTSSETRAHGVFE